MKPQSEISKYADDILADKFTIDPQVLARIIDKMHCSKDAKELKEKLAKCLRVKKAKSTPNKKSQKENIH